MKGQRSTRNKVAQHRYMPSDRHLFRGDQEILVDDITDESANRINESSGKKGEELKHH